MPVVLFLQHHILMCTIKAPYIVSTLSHFEIFLFIAPGSLMSLIAGLVFGGISAYGAFRITMDPQDKWTSLREFPDYNLN